MERDYLDIIKDKEFIELTTDERSEISELCASEDEFNALKAMLFQIDGMVVETIEPRKETKESLDQLFVQTHPKAAPLWYNSLLAVVVPKDKPIYRQPIMQLAAAFLIFWMVYPFFSTDLTNNSTQLAQVEKTEVEKQAETINEVESKEVHTPSEQPLNVAAPVTGSSQGLGYVAERNMPLAPVSSTLAIDATSPVMMDDVSSDEFWSHPDGIFTGSAESTISYAQPADETADLLDLLTATF